VNCRRKKPKSRFTARGKEVGSTRSEIQFKGWLHKTASWERAGGGEEHAMFKPASKVHDGVAENRQPTP